MYWDHKSAKTMYVMWLEEHLCNVGELHRVCLSSPVFKPDTEILDKTSLCMGILVLLDAVERDDKLSALEFLWRGRLQLGL
jgi:hypothetical protein